MLNRFNLAEAAIEYDDYQDEQLEKYIPFIKSQCKVNGKVDEDMFQEICLQIIEDDSFDPDRSNYFTYLYQFVKGRVINYVNKSKRIEERLYSANNKTEDGIEYLDMFQSDRTTYGEVMSKETKRQINRIIGLLDEKSRRIVLLRFGLFGERTHTFQEIGDKLNVSRQRINAKLNYILDDLNKFLKY